MQEITGLARRGFCPVSGLQFKTDHYSDQASRATWRMSPVGPGCVKTQFSWKGGAGSAKPISCSDRLYQSADAQNAHYPFHIVGQDVQGQFGTDVLERLHL